MRRLVNVAGSYVTQASVASISYKVFDTADGAVVTGPTSLSVSAVIFDALQQDSTLWTVDSVGFNFKTVLTGTTCFPNANKRYRVECQFVMASGSPVFAAWDVTTKDLLTTSG